MLMKVYEQLAELLEKEPLTEYPTEWSVINLSSDQLDCLQALIIHYHYLETGRLDPLPYGGNTTTGSKTPSYAIDRLPEGLKMMIASYLRLCSYQG